LIAAEGWELTGSTPDGSAVEGLLYADGPIGGYAISNSMLPK